MTVKTDVVAEYTSGSGVTIDGVLLKDGLVDGVDVGAPFAGLLATGATVGATSQAQAFTNGIVGPTWKPAADSTTALQLQTVAGASVLNVDTTNGRVGIGTSAPEALLELQTAIAPTFDGGFNNLRLKYSGGAAAGSVGAGIVFNQHTDSNYPTVFLRVGGMYGVKEAADGAYGGGLVFYTQPNSGAAMAERMRIGMSGNVGIGTTAPNTNLHILGAGDSYGNAVGMIIGNNFGGGTKTWQISVDDSYSKGLNFGEPGFADGRLFLKVGGNVGIGTTAPATTLHVVGAATITGGIRPAADGTTALQLQNAAGTNILNVDTTNGRVGIGTAEPQSTFHIKLGANMHILCATVSGLYPQLSFVNDTYGFAKAFIDGAPLSLNGSSNGDVLACQWGGNVGIGDAVPAEKLDVTGNINATGVYKVDDVQVLSNRVIDARCADVANSGDATTDGLIDALRDAMIAHGLLAAAA